LERVWRVVCYRLRSTKCYKVSPKGRAVFVVDDNQLPCTRELFREYQTACVLLLLISRMMLSAYIAPKCLFSDEVANIVAGECHARNIPRIELVAACSGAI